MTEELNKFEQGNLEKETVLPVVENTNEAIETKKVNQPAVFNWEELEAEKKELDVSERKKLEEMYAKTLHFITDQEVVEGEIIAIGEREVFVNIGYKSDGVIPISELKYNPDFKVGDKIEVYVDKQEDLLGQLILSHKKARLLKSWERAVQAYENDEVITGYIKCKTKGGFIVDVFGLEAFLPGSQIDVKPIRDYDVFVNTKMDLKIVKVNHEFKNIVVSHKVLIESELEQQKLEIMSKLKKGQILEGVVKNITAYGVFVDLGGVDGLIHITDLSWGRISHPEEVVKLEQKINVVILDFDESKKRIALGLKQLTPHPWDSLDPNLKVGDKVKGKVVVIADYGAFIEIQPGVEGLIHVSEMSWSQHLRSASDFLKIGQEVEAVILTLDREDRKMSLGIKQLIPDPWTNIKEKYPVGSRHKSIVRNFTNFGVFVELEEGVDGLVHISDLSWSKKIKHPSEFTKIGDELEVVVLEIDVENRRLTLGHKQLEENPWDAFVDTFAVNTIHKGTVMNITDKGATIMLPYGIEGFAPAKQLIKEDGSKLNVDEDAEFIVTEFNKDQRKIVVSHTKVWQLRQEEQKKQEKEKKEAEAKKTAKATKKASDNIEKPTLGDLGILSSVKEKIEQAEQQKKAKKNTKKSEE